MELKTPLLLHRNGITYPASLEPVHGAGSGVWHLMVGGYYWGRLRTVSDAWVLDCNRPGLELQTETLAKFAGGENNTAEFSPELS